MDALAIIALLGKGISIVSALIAAGQSAEPAIAGLLKLIEGAKAGTVTPEELAATEALLDQQIADFNLDLPPASP